MMIDVASGGELYVAGAPSRCSPRAPCPAREQQVDDELVLALDVGMGRIMVDSFDEIEWLNRLLGRVAPATRPRVLVRVNPGVEVSTHGVVRHRP